MAEKGTITPAHCVVNEKSTTGAWAIAPAQPADKALRELELLKAFPDTGDVYYLMSAIFTTLLSVIVLMILNRLQGVSYYESEKKM